MQQKINRQPPNPREAYEQAMIAMALTQSLSQEGSDPPFEALPAEEREALASSAQRLQDKLPELIRRGKHSPLHSFRQFLQGMLPAVKAAALVILIGNLMLTLAVATGALRTSFGSFRIELGDKFFSFRHQTTEQLADVPQDWAGPFFPAELPEGYTIQRIENTDPSFFFEAYNSEGRHLFFFVDPAGGNALYDFDGAPYDLVAVNNYAGYVFTNDFEKMILWHQDNWQISVCSSCSFEELLRTAQSVFPIF